MVFPPFSGLLVLWFPQVFNITYDFHVLLYGYRYYNHIPRFRDHKKRDDIDEGSLLYRDRSFSIQGQDAFNIGTRSSQYRDKEPSIQKNQFSIQRQEPFSIGTGSSQLEVESPLYRGRWFSIQRQEALYMKTGSSQHRESQPSIQGRTVFNIETGSPLQKAVLNI